jgi:hypothetical protein
MDMRLLNQGKVLFTEKMLRGIFLHKRERERENITRDTEDCIIRKLIINLSDIW